MGKPTGFMEYQRKTGNTVAPLERIKNFKEFHLQLPKKEQQMQAARCMACGVPFCQAGTMIAGMASGCPLQNLVPEWNDLVYLGNYEQAYRRLTKTNCFPEFTSRVCPALCEAACTCNVNGDPVCTKENERAIIENAWATGLITPQPPKVRTGKRVAVVGSGPSGLAAAMQLNRRGHSVTVFERRDRVGGLLRYGIPNMKLDKSVIDRRVDLMKAEGIEFVTNADIGILKFSDLFNFEIQQRNAEFFEKVGFVFIVEPSKLLATGQIGLNLLVGRFHKEVPVVYAACDRNCDGLVDALSHTLRTNITEVSATSQSASITSIMCWDADGE